MFLMTGLEFILGARAFTPPSRPDAITVGRRIVDREVVDGESPDSPFRAGETIYAHASVAGQRGKFVEHVWSRDGVEVARHYLPIGADRRWRTWSRHRVTAGDYVVEIFAPDGSRLARHAFTAFPSPRNPKRVPHLSRSATAGDPPSPDAKRARAARRV